MRMVRNTILPLKGFDAITVYPFVFVRKDRLLSDRLIRHEAIHGEQQKELPITGAALAAALWYFIGWLSLLFVPLFFWWYGIEYLIRFVVYRNADRAYRNICFEREAYENEGNHDYLESRRRYAFLKYVFYHKIIK